MDENINIDNDLVGKEKYISLLPQLKALIEPETNLIANLANIAAVLKSGFNFFWVGFYLFDGRELVLGPFQGPIACTRIAIGKGVCGRAFQQQKTFLVPDVEKFEGHIACNAESKSEIVIPIFKKGKVVAVLDVDSDKINDFDSNDQMGLEAIAKLISSKFT